jgi:predicted PurR-regulated permease PerM
LQDQSTRVAASGPTGWVLVILSLGFFLYLLRSALLPFLCPAILAYICSPLVDRLARRIHVRRWAAAVGVFAVLLGAAASIGWLVLPAVVREAAQIAADPRGVTIALTRNLVQSQAVEAIFGRSVDPTVIADRLGRVVEDGLANNGIWARLAGWSVAGVFGLTLSVVLLAYFLLDGPDIVAGMFRMVPPHRRAFLRRVWVRLDPVLRRYFLAIAAIVVYASCAAYLGLGLILHLRHALPLALLTGVLELIPVIGPAASGIGAGLVALHQAHGAADIAAYVVYAFALRISIDQLFGPLVLGRAGSISPVLVIFCFIAGGLIYGVAGVILAMPTALGIKVVLSVLYEGTHTESVRV